jgi:hypothetical protein
MLAGVGRNSAKGEPLINEYSIELSDIPKNILHVGRI